MTGSSSLGYLALSSAMLGRLEFNPNFIDMSSAMDALSYRASQSVALPDFIKTISPNEPRRSRRRRQCRKIRRHSDSGMSAQKAYRRDQLVGTARAHFVDGVDIRDDVYLNSHARQMRALKLVQSSQTLSELRSRSRYNPAGMVK